MARELPGRVGGWLLAALLIGLVGVITGFVADEYTDAGWTVPLRGVLLAVDVVCYVVFAVKWWRWRSAERSTAEHGHQQH